MKLTIPYGLFLILSILFSGCRKKNQCIPAPDISGIHIDLTIERVDRELMDARTREDLSKVLKNHKIFSEMFLYESQYPSDSLFYNHIYSLFRDTGIDTLYREIHRVFGDLSDIRSEFEDAFKRLTVFYPGYRIPKIEIVISGISKDMYVSDSLIILGLDFYLGNGAKYRPNDIPEYMLKRYQKRNLVPNTFLFISEAFNRMDHNDRTLLADMLFYGKSFQFAKQMLPCVPDSAFLGYSPKEMNDIYESQEVIWASFIENQVLFTTDKSLKDKFISERPHTFEIGQNCPGRIGRWVGWEIVKSYLSRNADVSISAFMNNSVSQDIFVKSKFKPHNRRY